MWSNTIAGYSLKLLDKHQKYYPSSSLRKTYGIALTVGILSLIANMTANALLK